MFWGFLEPPTPYIRTFLLHKVRGNCHFLDHPPTPMPLRNIKMAPKFKLVKSFFYHLDRFSRNVAETNKTFWFLGIKNREIYFFFNFFSTKVSNFVSNLIDNCSQLSFDVYNIFVAQKLPILSFFDQFFFIWTLAIVAHHDELLTQWRYI